jgi:hypothetical protein
MRRVVGCLECLLVAPRAVLAKDTGSISGSVTGRWVPRWATPEPCPNIPLCGCFP